MFAANCGNGAPGFDSTQPRKPSVPNSLILRVAGFEDAVRRDQKQVAGFDVDFHRGELRVRYQAEWKLLQAELAEGAVRVAVVKDGRVSGERMANSALGTKLQCGKGCVHVALLDRGQDVVQPVQQQGKAFGGGGRLKQGSARGGFEHAHQDAGLQSMPCDVCYVGDIAIAGGDEIDEIATDASLGRVSP